MLDLVLHPACRQLLCFQSAARLRKLLGGFSSPRRFVLSCLGLALMIFWLGNAVLSVLLRQANSLETLRTWIPLGLTAYGAWHVLKLMYRRPEHGIDWSAAELEYLCTAPLPRRQLLRYRMVQIALASLPKAICFAALMIPDLPQPLFGLVGALLALVFLELIRMACEIGAHAVSTATYRWFRILAILITLGLLAAVGSALLQRLSDPATVRSPLFVFEHVLQLCSRWSQTSIGKLLLIPCSLFGQIITTVELNSAAVVRVGVAAMLVGSLSGLVLVVDGWANRMVKRRERASFHRSHDRCAPRQLRVGAAPVRLPRVPLLAGAGPVFWRQLLGAWHYRTSLLVALILPTVLACTPMIAFRSPELLLVNIVGALVFYSFLLLPAAFKFDFRRDVDRIALLKTLPTPAWALVCGQLATPVTLATLYQLTVLGFAWATMSISPVLILASVLLLFPVNVLIFAVENLIFLLYPHRLQQEGFDVFLRSTLTFTGKGLAFLLGAGVFFVWAMCSRYLADLLATQAAVAVSSRAIFMSGAWIFVCAVTAVCTWLLVLAYHRFDPSRDVPA